MINLTSNGRRIFFVNFSDFERNKLFNTAIFWDSQVCQPTAGETSIILLSVDLDTGPFFLFLIIFFGNLLFFRLWLEFVLAFFPLYGIIVCFLPPGVCPFPYFHFAFLFFFFSFLFPFAFCCGFVVPWGVCSFFFFFFFFHSLYASWL